MASGLVITSNTLSPGLAAFVPETDKKVGAVVEFFTPQVEGYARANAPWTDQTGNARNGLGAEAFHEPPVRHGIDLSHSMPYGIWLEVKNEGRYAIIIPTIKVQGLALMAVLRDVLN